MPHDFYPRREADIVTWSANFHARISAEPVRYGLTALQAADYAVKHAAFAAAHQAANNPSTNSRTATVAKEAARVALEADARKLAGIARATPGVTPEMRVTLGLCPRNGGGRSARVGRPTRLPFAHVVGVQHRTVTLRLSDSDSPTRARKPRGVAGATILRFVGNDPPADPARWAFACNTTTTTVNVQFNNPPLSPGTKVWLIACWLNARGQSGPACRPVYTHLSDGATLPAKRAA